MNVLLNAKYHTDSMVDMHLPIVCGTLIVNQSHNDIVAANNYLLDMRNLVMINDKSVNNHCLCRVFSFMCVVHTEAGVSLFEVSNIKSKLIFYS